MKRAGALIFLLLYATYALSNIQQGDTNSSPGQQGDTPEPILGSRFSPNSFETTLPQLAPPNNPLWRPMIQRPYSGPPGEDGIPQAPGSRARGVSEPSFITNPERSPWYEPEDPKMQMLMASAFSNLLAVNELSSSQLLERVQALWKSQSNNHHPGGFVLLELGPLSTISGEVITESIENLKAAGINPNETEVAIVNYKSKRYLLSRWLTVDNMKTKSVACAVFYRR